MGEYIFVGLSQQVYGDLLEQSQETGTEFDTWKSGVLQYKPKNVAMTWKCDNG